MPTETFVRGESGRWGGGGGGGAPKIAHHKKKKVPLMVKSPSPWRKWLPIRKKNGPPLDKKTPSMRKMPP